MAEDGYYVTIDKAEWEETVSLAIMVQGLKEAADEVVVAAEIQRVELEKLKIENDALTDVKEEKETYEKAFYSMRDRTVGLVRAIRRHKTTVAYGGRAEVANETLWETTTGYPGRD